ncbi:MAG: DEAD/DEAH box helicase family protein [Lentisphaerae bacterium]|nr:DEAD/DEAH box helicase family protein [Lentisphaerota bacterium]
MPNLVEVNYGRTGRSTNTDALGMREMQARAFAARDAQYLLVKAPPASGKSRALMFLALDKMLNQGVSKTIVAVPERSIGSSFASTKLSEHGFYADWEVSPKRDLCSPGGEPQKVKQFQEFLQSDDRILVCTHATLRFAFQSLDTAAFNNVLVAIDEFHHVSADTGNQLGEVLRDVLRNSSAHIIAMTGSYFRGDSVPVLLPEDEAKFTHVVYNYYEQLNGYRYLKSLGIGYHFYQGKYTAAIGIILDTDKKTILHIPNVNSGESTKQKHDEVDFILDSIGTVERQDPTTGIITVKRRSDGKRLKVADLVWDAPTDRDKVITYLRNIRKPEDIDLIIALGMAKEGFDWVFCEHALTVGYRGSLTEVVQIIGRCTRDSENKTHAQFTNLIARPDAADELLTVSVNNMLKAITCSLLMEQVLAPSFKFKTKRSDDDISGPDELKIRGLKEPSSQRVKDIVESDLNDLKATILQDDTMQKAMPGNVDPEVINKILIPKIIRTKYPDLSETECEEIRQYVVADSVLRNAQIEETGDKRFIRMANQFVNIDDLHIDLIDRINPFQKAFEILSKQVTPNVLKAIMECIESTRCQVTEDEAVLMWPKIKLFAKTSGREPSLTALDPMEKRMAEVLAYIKNQRRQKGL